MAHFKNTLKNVIKIGLFTRLFVSIIFFQVLTLKSIYAVENNKVNLYVMLDVDGTITQRIDPNDIKTITRVEEAGFHCYRLKFIASKYVHPKYYRWYHSMLENKILRDEQKINVSILDENTLEIEEVVVLRPSIPSFLEKLDQLNNNHVSVKLYIASRNDDIRNQNLINRLKVNINGIPFKDKVKLIPREDFRIHVFSPIEGWIAGKSAALVRAKFKNEKNEKIESNAFIVFVDNIIPERFVKGDRDLDQLLRPTRFIISNLNNTDIEKDRQDFQSIYKSIEKLVKNEN